MTDQSFLLLEHNDGRSRICDTQENQDRLANLVHTEHSDFSATYHVNLQETKEGIASMAVTPTVLETWGITVEQLHQDALVSDMNRHPLFCDMQNMMESMLFGREPENLLDDGSGQSGMGMYCLTNGDKMNGAGLILQGDLMQQIGEIVGGDFYILPSSCHEVLVIPESMGMDVKELSAMVYSRSTRQKYPQKTVYPITSSIMTAKKPSWKMQRNAYPVLKKKRQKQKLQRRVFMIALEKRNSRAKRRKLWRRS